MNSKPFAMSVSPIDDASLPDADLAAMVAGGNRTAVMALARRFVEPVHTLIARAVPDGVEVTRLTRASIVDSLVDILVAPASYWRGLTGLDDLDGSMRVRVAFFRSSIDRLSSIPWPETDAPLTVSESDGPAQPGVSGVSGVEIIATATIALSWEDRLLLDLSLREGLPESGLSRAIGLPPGQTRRRLEQARTSLLQAAATVSGGDAHQIADWESLYARVPSPVISEDMWRRVHRDLSVRWPANDVGVPDDSMNWAPPVVENVNDEVSVEQIAPPVSGAAVDPAVPELNPGPYQAEVITTRFRTFQGLRAAAEGPVDRMRSRWGNGARRADSSEGADSRPAGSTFRPHQPLLRDNSPEPIAGSAANRALNDVASDAPVPPAFDQKTASNTPVDTLPSPMYRTRAADELLHRTQGAVISFDNPAESPARQTPMHVNSDALAPYSRPVRLRTASVGRLRWAILIALLLLLAFVVVQGTGVLTLPGFSFPFFAGASDRAP